MAELTLVDALVRLHQARFIFLNTSGHAAERRSDGSNARITREMNAGKRCSTALADHSTGAAKTERSEGWLGGRDSNPDNGVQSAVSYR